MSAKGYYLSQEAHVINLIPPVSLSATTTSRKFSLANWRHASILIQLGVTGTTPTITLNASDNGSPETLTALPFNLHKCETDYLAANADVLGARVATAAAGFQPAGTDNIFYVIELDADTLPQGSPYVEVVLTSPTTCITSVAVVLSGGRYEHESSESVVV
jgi:hypothetical protein